jgi:hypothetical protein
MFSELVAIPDTRTTNTHVTDFALRFAQQLSAKVLVSYIAKRNADENEKRLLESVATQADDLGVAVRLQRQNVSYLQVMRGLQVVQGLEVSQGLEPDVKQTCLVVSHEFFSQQFFIASQRFPVVVVPSGHTWQVPSRFEKLLVFPEAESVDALGAAARLATSLGAAACGVSLCELPVTPPKSARAWMYVDREQVVADFEAERERLRHKSKHFLFKARREVPEVLLDSHETTSAALLPTAKTVARHHAPDLLLIDSKADSSSDRQVRRHLVDYLSRTWPVLLLADSLKR